MRIGVFGFGHVEIFGFLVHFFDETDVAGAFGQFFKQNLNSKGRVVVEVLTTRSGAIF